MGHKLVDYESFNKKFFEKTALKLMWFGRKGVVLVKDGINAEVTLSTNCTGISTSGEYVSYHVKILGKDGEITSHTFEFKDYLKERIDNRKDSHAKHYYAGNNFHISDNCCQDDGIADWYIMQPSEREMNAMASKIVAYISQYQNI
jgi:hypothetical protein